MSETFTEGPKLNTGRFQHSAGGIDDSVTKEGIIVVAGGRKDENIGLNSTEILKGNIWEEGIWEEGNNS